MNDLKAETRGGVLAHAHCLYGLYTPLSNASFLSGYYQLPEGFMSGSPRTVTSEMSARPESFWSQFAITLLSNLGFTATLALVLKFNRVKGVPALLPRNLERPAMGFAG